MARPRRTVAGGRLARTRELEQVVAGCAARPPDPRLSRCPWCPRKCRPYSGSRQSRRRAARRWEIWARVDRGVVEIVAPRRRAPGMAIGNPAHRHGEHDIARRLARQLVSILHARIKRAHEKARGAQALQHGHGIDAEGQRPRWCRRWCCRGSAAAALACPRQTWPGSDCGSTLSPLIGTGEMDKPCPLSSPNRSAGTARSCGGRGVGAVQPQRDGDLGSDFDRLCARGIRHDVGALRDALVEQSARQRRGERAPARSCRRRIDRRW